MSHNAFLKAGFRENQQKYLRDMSDLSVLVGTKMQEIVVSRGKILELLRPDANTGKVHTLLTVEVFGIIRSLMAFRLTGGTKGTEITSYALTCMCL